MKLKRLFPSLHLFLLLVLTNLMLFSVFRVVFYLWFKFPDDSITLVMLSKAFYIGFKYDLQLAILMNLPIVLLAWLPLLKITLKRFAQYFWLTYLFFVNSCFIYIYFIDIGHYDYLNKRIDVTIVRFLEDIAISMEMVWESYPVIRILGGFLILTAALMWALRRCYQYVANYPRVATTKKYKTGLLLVSFALIFLGILGKFSTYPLRWSDAFFSTNPFISALASNPVVYFTNTLKNKDSGYDLEQSAAAYPLMAEYLGIPPTNPEKSPQKTMNFSRQEHSHAPFKLNKPNVVMVFLESFAYYKTGLSGNPLNPTPNFDAIAKQGVLFDHFYTPHGGTARSVFTAITGIPDIEMVKTSSRNPLIVSQQTVINSFKGYKKFYFIGGSVAWGNIRGLLGNNITDMNIYEEQDYESPRIDVWGIQDLDLFKEANQVLNQTREPFFAVIQTSGNHRPYTIPDDNHGFEILNKKLADVEPYGFRSVADYNSFRYLDHSLGYYLELLKKELYAQNTVFVFFGDHGNERQAKHLRPSEEQLGLTEFRVPFLLYAPGLIKQAQVIHKVASQVDLLPTIASTAGISYTNTTFGRDLFNPKFDDKRYAFTFSRSQPPELGLISDKFYFKMKNGGINPSLFKLDSQTPTENLTSQYPELAKEMQQLAQAYYESIRYVRHNNSSTLQ